MIGAVTRDEVDIAVAAFTLSNRRLNVVDFLIPLTDTEYVNTL